MCGGLPRSTGGCEVDHHRTGRHRFPNLGVFRGRSEPAARDGQSPAHLGEVAMQSYLLHQDLFPIDRNQRHLGHPLNKTSCFGHASIVVGVYPLARSVHGCLCYTSESYFGWPTTARMLQIVQCRRKQDGLVARMGISLWVAFPCCQICGP